MAHKRAEVQSQQEFFETNSENCTKEFLAEQVYIMIHTYYMKDGIKIKPEMGKAWQTLFGRYMEHTSFEYLLTLAPVMLRDSVIAETKAGEKINSLKFIRRSTVGFEFDLWLIERQREGKKLELSEFEAYIKEKYGNFLLRQWGYFQGDDLKYINDFENIIKALEPQYDKILAFFEKFVENNRMKIEFDNESVKRTKVYGKVQVKATTSAKTLEESGMQITSESQAACTSQPTKEQQAACDMGQKEREYQIIIKEKEERIEKLENDIKEFKRQRDESREYSANQYDRGIKDLFSTMNDIRYGKIIDYLYSLLQNPQTDENLASYLDNLFMAFEDMEIEPIVENGNLSVKEENLIKHFNLDFDKSEYDAKKVCLKYAGWKYKDIPMEKPTLTLKEE